jgi:hypothetical protein
MLAPAETIFEREKFVLIQFGEARQIHRAQIVARSFHPQNRNQRAAQRILGGDFCRGVAAAEIGHAKVGAQQVRAVQKQPRL